MSQHKRGIARTQTALLPAAVEDYVARDSVARVIDAYVTGLDVRAAGFAHSVPSDTGRPSYAPDDLLRLYLYGYWNRVRSSRKLEAECRRNLEVMWLLGQLAPDHKTIAEFRRINAQPFRSACAQFVQFLREAQLVGADEPVVAIDGSKFKACAAKSSVLDAEQLARERERIDKRIAEYLAQMAAADRQDEAEAQITAEQIQAALEKLKKRGQKLEQAAVDLAGRAQSAAPDSTPRVGLTDADCVLLIGKGGEALAGYNVQQAVDAQHKFIVAHEVTTQRNDHASLEPMATQAQQALGAHALTVVADTGYMNGAQAQGCEEQAITPVMPMPQPAQTKAAECYPKTLFTYDAASDTYRCPAGEVLKRYKRSHTLQTDYYATRACAQCASKAQCTRGKYRSIARSWFADAAERAHARALQRRDLMRLRGNCAEHPFGNLKAMLNGAFAVRTLPKVKGEMALAVLTYNLKRAANVLGIEQLIEKLWLRSAWAAIEV
jgi:transposase